MACILYLGSHVIQAEERRLLICKLRFGDLCLLGQKSCNLLKSAEFIHSKTYHIARKIIFIGKSVKSEYSQNGLGKRPNQTLRKGVRA